MRQRYIFAWVKIKFCAVNFFYYYYLLFYFFIAWVKNSSVGIYLFICLFFCVVQFLFRVSTIFSWVPSQKPVWVLLSSLVPKADLRSPQYFRRSSLWHKLKPGLPLTIARKSSVLNVAGVLYTPLNTINILYYS